MYYVRRYSIAVLADVGEVVDGRVVLATLLPVYRVETRARVGVCDLIAT